MDNADLQQIMIKIDKLTRDVEFLKKKLRFPNNIVQIKNARFYLPNYPTDCIQDSIVTNRDYWDMQALRIINKYLKDDAVILDIGTHIGR